MVYYIDNRNGKAAGDGSSPENAVCDYRKINAHKGDVLRFKRGCVFYGGLELTSGEDDAPITYSAYGEGENPVFSGGTDVSSERDWEITDTPNVWKCVKETCGSVGNFVFNGNGCAATMRWDLSGLCNQGDFFDTMGVENNLDDTVCADHLYLYSVGNPSIYYKKIIAIDYGNRQLCKVKDNVVIDSIKFENTSVHAIAGGRGAKNITIRNCSFENIGGCIFDYKLRIRFGNAVEFWVYAENILVENCVFKNIYDSCVTHQGPGEKTIPAKNFVVRNCVFEKYGMAAFEYRDKLPIDSSFTNNICRDAGSGFSMLGENPPRSSEIWPQPMGHHIFLWRIDDATEGGNLHIENNVFGDAIVGAAVYSIIDERAEKQITLNNNRYTKNDVLLVRFGKENFNNLEQYKKKSGQDANSFYVE